MLDLPPICGLFGLRGFLNHVKQRGLLPYPLPALFCLSMQPFPLWVTKDTQSQLFWPPEEARPTGKMCMRAAKPYPHHLWARCPAGWCLPQLPALSHRQKNHGEKQLSKLPSRAAPHSCHHSRFLVSNFSTGDFSKIPLSPSESH